MNILSINLAVCSVILVGLVIRGKNDDVKNCSLNLLEKTQLSDFKRSMLKSPIKYVTLFDLSVLLRILFKLVSNISNLLFWWS